MRFVYPLEGLGTTTDQNGKILQGVTVSVFLTGTTIPAKIYTANSGGTAVNSIVSDSVNGTFVFYVDDGDYSVTQGFDIVFSMAHFATKTISNFTIMSLPTWNTQTITFYNTQTVTTVSTVLKQSLTGNLNLTYPGGIKLILLLTPNGAQRNISFIQTPTPFPTGFEVFCYNYGGYDLVLDSAGISVVVHAYTGKSIFFDGTNWLDPNWASGN